MVPQVGSCPTAAELQAVAAHLHQHRGSCEAVAAPWLYACNDARRPADADDFLLPPEALASVARYQQARALPFACLQRLHSSASLRCGGLTAAMEHSTDATAGQRVSQPASSAVL